MPNPKDCEALIRVRDGQSCPFPSYLIWPGLAGECQGSFIFFFQSFQPDSRPAKEIDFRMLTAWPAEERMDTSEGAVTFKLVLKVVVVGGEYFSSFVYVFVPVFLNWAYLN